MNPYCVLMCKKWNSLEGHTSRCNQCSSLSDGITVHFDFPIFAYFYLITFHIISMYCFSFKVFVIEVKFYLQWKTHTDHTIWWVLANVHIHVTQAKYEVQSRYNPNNDITPITICKNPIAPESSLLTPFQSVFTYHKNQCSDFYHHRCACHFLT